ncbi:MAG: hypothetical protein LQ350_006425 [Teloschistes chrysophthalmus]|nr:MAG: hypothetical protein LQ350_006425 [Niorma chrysophthalma]
MFGFGESQEAHQQVYGDGDTENEAKFSHELLGGAAAFEGMKLFEDRQRKEGKTVSHAFAKEALAGLVGAEVDRLAETKGMDAYDHERARHHAQKSAENMYDEHYVRGQGAEEYDPQAYGRPSQFEGGSGGYGGGNGNGGGYGGGNEGGYGGGGRDY